MTLKKLFCTNKTLGVLLAVAVLPLLLAHHNGVAEEQDKDRTGAPGSDPPCSNTLCHDDGSFDPTFTIEVLDLNSEEAILEYVPGQTYGLRFTVAAPGALRFGFQATALIDSDLSNAGTFQNPGIKVQLEGVDGRHIVEHSNGAFPGVFEAEWVAPDSASGDVTFYASAVAANGNQESSGDGYNGTSITLNEGGPVSIQKTAGSETEVYTSNGNLIIRSIYSAEITLYTITGQPIMLKRIDSGGSIIPIGFQGLGVLECRLSNGKSLIYKLLF
jgi:hypothetical protein